MDSSRLQQSLDVPAENVVSIHDSMMYQVEQVIEPDYFSEQSDIVGALATIRTQYQLSSNENHRVISLSLTGLRYSDILGKQQKPRHIHFCGWSFPIPVEGRVRLLYDAATLSKSDLTQSRNVSDVFLNLSFVCWTFFILGTVCQYGYLSLFRRGTWQDLYMYIWIALT